MESSGEPQVQAADIVVLQCPEANFLQLLENVALYIEHVHGSSDTMYVWIDVLSLPAVPVRADENPTKTQHRSAAVLHVCDCKRAAASGLVVRCSVSLSCSHVGTMAEIPDNTTSNPVSPLLLSSSSLPSLSFGLAPSAFSA